MNKIILLLLVLMCASGGIVWAVDAAAAINPKDAAEMMLIPAGEFMMGTSDKQISDWLNTHPDDKRDWFTNQESQHKVYLDSFYMYKTDVTVVQYRKFCDATNRQMPRLPDWAKDDHPIMNVSWDDAQAYAKWAGVALPTEAQWEKAARGMDGRMFPWGNDWDAGKVQCSKIKFGDVNTTVPVGSFPAGASPYGCLDMAGNVWEWCADWYDAGYYKYSLFRNPVGPSKGTARVLRGGSWYDTNPASFLTAFRYSFSPAPGYINMGFRCAVNAPILPPAMYAAAKINITTIPLGAVVLIDDVKQANVTPSTTEILFTDSTPRIVNIEIHLDDYHVMTEKISLKPGESDDLTITLKHNTETVPAQPLVTKVNPKDDAEMVLIPAGEFQMGTSDEQVAAWLKTHPDEPEDFYSETPQHTVNLDGYYIYKSEVTVAQFRKFCQATERTMPKEPDWKWQETYPIVNVTWDDAKAYAEWAGAALPTEAQWEKAARCGDGRVYPWGNSWPPPAKAGNFADRTLKPKYPVNWIIFADYDDGYVNTSPVGSFAANPYGMYDLAGNVWEWCADWYQTDYYRDAPVKNPTGPITGHWRVTRGGSWNVGVSKNLRTTYRGTFDPLECGDNFGFRCVVPVPGT